jgi:L-cysteine:1D-myo-inositol 2-amino-2-deoxy-alpha-D-glucopyranoside ligase
MVWLAARAGEPHWPSPFGPGRPGWHVECAAIATEHLGARFDVQAGGSDLIFPHHEMSASHARVVYGGSGPDGPAFARRYLHAGMIRLDGEKMSKSLGNLVFVSALLAQGADPMAVRLALLAGHYRADRDWAATGLAAAEGRLAQWRTAVARAGTAPGPPGAAAGAERVLAAVRERMASDLDTPGALAAVDEWAAETASAATLPPGPAGGAALVRDTVDALLGIAL